MRNSVNVAKNHIFLDSALELQDCILYFQAWSHPFTNLVGNYGSPNFDQHVA